VGLDIYHLYAKREAGRDFCRVDGVLEEMKPLQSYFQKHENAHLDWETMFSARGLDYRNYAQRSRTTNGIHTAFGFVDAASTSLNDPIKVVFSNERLLRRLPSFMQPKMLRHPQFKNARKFLGPFATVMKVETVVFNDTVGYQRNGVADAFYRTFKPDDVTCLRQRVETIYEVTEPKLRDQFKRVFLDNWDEGRSFVLISW
jgi:hypothetical protein